MRGQKSSGAVEGGGAQPVLERQVVRIADAHAPLLGRIDEEEPAERPERLTAERLLRLLVDEDDPLAGLGQLGGGDQPGKAGADNDHIRVVSHASPSPIRNSQPEPSRPTEGQTADHCPNALLSIVGCPTERNKYRARTQITFRRDWRRFVAHTIPVAPYARRLSAAGAAGGSQPKTLRPPY